MKPLEEAYRARNQSCRLSIEAAHGALTPELVKETLRIRASHIKRFLVKARDAGTVDDVTVILGRVSSQDIASFVQKLRAVNGVHRVSVAAQGA